MNCITETKIYGLQKKKKALRPLLAPLNSITGRGRQRVLLLSGALLYRIKSFSQKRFHFFLLL